jgi:hypothetical protein
MKLKQIGGGPQFVVFHLICWDAPYANWASFCEKLSGDSSISVIRLDQMTSLLNQYGQTPNVLILIGSLALIWGGMGCMWWVFHRKSKGGVL